MLGDFLHISPCRSLPEDGHHHLGVLDALPIDSIGEGGQGTWSPIYVGTPYKVTVTVDFVGNTIW